MLSEELEQTLRAKFSRLEGRAKVPPAVEARLAQHDYRPRAGHRGLATAATASVALVATGVAVPLAVHANEGTTTTLRLTSYSLRLPARYQEVRAGSVLCNPLALFAYVPTPGGTPPGPPTRPAEPGIVSAADQAGACVSIGMNAPYTPGAPGATFIATRPRVTEPVHVSRYQGWVGTWTWTGSGLNGGDMVVDGVPTPSGSTEEILDLTVPASDDRVQDLTVAATGVTAAELVLMVSAGLSTPPAAAATTTAPAPGGTTTGPKEREDRRALEGRFWPAAEGAWAGTGPRRFCSALGPGLPHAGPSIRAAQDAVPQVVLPMFELQYLFWIGRYLFGSPAPRGSAQRSALSGAALLAQMAQT